MSDLPRFEDVDLTPTWDDVDPAALDFGVGATEIDVDATELDHPPPPPEPGPPPEPQREPDPEPDPDPEPHAGDAADVAAFEPPTVEVVEEVGDAGAFWEQVDQFDAGPIQPETVPDDFDDLG